jgi:flagellar protein FliS
MNETMPITTVERLLAASPSRLVVMLYDEALKNLVAATEAIARGDIEARCHATNRAIEILCHLYLTLDIKQGGEIAERLADIYRFVLSRLPRVNALNDAAPAHEAIRLLSPVRASWHELDARIEASLAASEPLPPQPLTCGPLLSA